MNAKGLVRKSLGEMVEPALNDIIGAVEADHENFAIPSFHGGFEERQPRQRLEACIGYLMAVL